MKLGSLLAIITCSGCEGQIDWVWHEQWIFENKSSYSIEVQGFKDDSWKYVNFTLEPHEAKKFEFHGEGSKGSKELEEPSYGIPEGIYFPFDDHNNTGTNIIINQSDTIPLMPGISVMNKKEYKVENVARREYHYTYTFTDKNIEELLKSKQEQE